MCVNNWNTFTLKTFAAFALLTQCYIRYIEIEWLEMKISKSFEHLFSINSELESESEIDFQNQLPQTNAN